MACPQSAQRPSASVRRWLATCLAALLLTASGTATATGVPRPGPAAAGDGTVVADWNAIAVSTLLAAPPKQPVEDFLYAAFVQAAVYNAVVGVEELYEPYRFDARAP